MPALLDSVVVGLRAVSFLAVFQAAGCALALGLYGSDLKVSVRIIRSVGLGAAVAGIVLTAAHHALVPVRMTGTFDGVFDAALQMLSLTSDAGTARSVRILGLVLVAGSLWNRRAGAGALGIVGATLTAASFALMGHTVAHEHRWLLAGVLLVHVLVVVYWYGALVALYAAGRHEPLTTTAALAERFSRSATRLVPAILLAGLAMAVVLMPDLASLGSPYGVLVLTKAVLFAALMGLAALNKWRLAPALRNGDVAALASLRRSVAAERVLIAVILAATAVMTGLFSPEA